MPEPLPPADPNPPEPEPRKRRTFFGPANAAGFGGWCGVAWPLLAATVYEAGVRVLLVPADAAVLALYAAVCFVWSFFLVIPGYFAGWVGSILVRWVQRRRAAAWDPWRAEFAAGFLAGTALVAGLVVAAVTLTA